MIICLPLDSNDIRRHLSSSDLILLFDKGCCHYISTVPKINMNNGRYRYFYRDPLRSLTLLSLNVLSQKS